MVSPSVRPLPLLAMALALATVVAAPAFAAKPAQTAKPPKLPKPAHANAGAVKALEAQIHELRAEEKAALKTLDEQYEHVIRSLDPKEVRVQLQGILVELREVNVLLGAHDELNYGGNRIRARESIEKADHQIDRALRRDTAEERAKAAHDLGAVYDDIRLALAFSAEHPLAGDGPNELARRALENERLVAAVPRIGLAYRLLQAVDHEVSDYKAEKRILHEKHEATEREVKEQFQAKIEALEGQIHAQKK